jgi:hypothetical protein
MGATADLPSESSWISAVAGALLGTRTTSVAQPEASVVPIPESTTKSQRKDNARCSADWRRPDEQWQCVRPAGHRGRHWMRRGEQMDD